MVDEDLMNVQLGETSPNARQLLAGLLDDDLIETFHYPEDPSAVSFAEGRDAPAGWIAHGRADNEIIQVAYRQDRSVVYTGIFTNLADAAEKDSGANCYRDWAPSESADLRRRDVLAAETARSLKVDIFLTERPYIFQSRYLRDAPAYGVEQGLALVGLYLRGQHKFIVHPGIGGWPLSFDRGLFYLVGTREYLPASWRWFGACVKTGERPDGNDMTYLGQSLLHRVSRALEMRDQFHRSVNRVHNNNIGDDVVAELDMVLLLLMGAVDVAARVAHHSLGLPASHVYTASWQNRSWIRLVKKLDSALAEVVAGGTDAGNTLTILRLLRNSIHGEAPHSIGRSRGGSRRTDTLMGLPRQNADELRDAFDALGGVEEWGLEDWGPERLHIRPEALMEGLFPRVLVLLDELMRRTPVERMASVVMSPQECEPPDDGPTGVWSNLNRKCIRSQLSL